MRRFFKWLGIILGVLIIVGVLLAIFFDWNWVRGPVSSLVSKELDRRFVINGDLDVDLSMTPRITAHDVELANAPWGSKEQMLDLDRLEFNIAFKKLIDGQVVVPEIRLSKPRLVLEKDKSGKANWEFPVLEKKKPDKSTEPPKIGMLYIDDGKLIYRDPNKNTEADLTVATGLDAAEKHIIKVKGGGRYEGAKMLTEVSAGSLLSLREKREPYPVNVEVSFGKTNVTAKGTLKDPVQFEEPNLMFKVQGADLAEFDRVIGVSLPHTPPYKISGHLTQEKQKWILKDFQGNVGDSDVAGDVVYMTRNKRPFLQADLTSKKLDFKDLAGFLGAEPTPEPEQAESNKVFPDKPYDLKGLRNGDADVKLKSNNIVTPDLPIDQFTVHLQLENGNLNLDPLNFGIDIGQITSNINLNAQQDKIATKATLEIQKVPFKRLLAGTRFEPQSGGTFIGRAKLASTGNSIAEMLGYADGNIAVIMGNGRISNLLVDLIGLDIAKSLAMAVTKDPSIPIRCVIADFDVKQGLMTAQPLVIDTTKSNIIGEGQINLRDEILDMRLTAHPKTPSVLSARAPLLIKGTLKNPTGYPDPKYLAAKAAVSVALGATLTPVAAIIPWIELGLGKDSECQELIAQAKQRSAGAPPKPPAHAQPKAPPK